MNTVSSSKPDPSRQKVILLFGPTGVGKTEALVELFSGTGEVVSADSMQVYRGLDIGTAKPGDEVIEQVKHHLIDIRDPDEQYNAGDFVHAADRIVADIASRDKIPVISGGTPFYFRNFIYGLPESPPGDPVVRAQIKAEIEEKGVQYAFEYLREVDPEAAEKISPRDVYRIERALEVYRVAGERLSSYSVSYEERSMFEMLLIGLDRPREELSRRIESRVEKMFSHGLISEVASLVQAGYKEGDPGMQGIGYSEFFSMRKDGCATIKNIREMISRNTRRYAKRQLTFFRHFPSTAWYHPDDVDTISKLISDFLE